MERPLIFRLSGSLRCESGVSQRQRGHSGLDDMLKQSVLDSSSVKSVGELLHVAGEVLLTHAMVRPSEPRLEVREDRMNPRQ